MQDVQHKKYEKACILRQCTENPRKNRIISFQIENEEITKLLVKGVLHSHTYGDIIHQIITIATTYMIKFKQNKIRQSKVQCEDGAQ